VCVFSPSLSLSVLSQSPSFERVFGIGRKIVAFLRFRKSLGSSWFEGAHNMGDIVARVSVEI
jgi:hypothetical protein